MAPPAPLRLTLEESLRLAISSSPRLREGVARYREAGAVVDEARVLGMPDLRLTARYAHNTPDTALTTPLGTFQVIPESVCTMAVTFRQPIWTGGRLHYAVQAARFGQKAAGQGFVSTAHDLQTAVRLAFQELVLADEVIGVAREQLKLQQQQLAVSQAQYQAGLAARFNVLSAESNLSKAEQDLMEALKARQLAADHLLIILGLAAGQPVELVPPDLPDAVQGAVDPWVALALERRPELRQFNEAIRAEESRRQFEVCATAPHLDLQVQRFQQTQTAFTPERQVVAALQFTIPLYDGGLARARSSQAECRTEELRQQREEARRNVVLQVRQTHTELTNACGRMLVAERNVTEAREALRAARCRYESGLSTLVEFQAAQAALVQALVSRSQVRFQYVSATARWRRAIADPSLDVSLEEVRTR